MTHKCVLVLANSVKLNGRCLAGREVISERGRHRLGPWLRPVSGHGEGELWEDERCYKDGNPVNVLDFADLDVIERVSNSYQPENWRIPSQRPWRKTAVAYKRPRRCVLEEQPEDLWLEPGNRSDRISHERLVAYPPSQSLFVVRPENLRIQLYTDSWNGQLKRKRRCLFRYRGTDYDMALTDPVMNERYGGQMPEYGRPPQEIRLPYGNDLLICVSLAGEFMGHHYKLVATVLEDFS